MTWRESWQPGDPLYSHFFTDTGDDRTDPGEWDETYGRAMVEIIDDVHPRRTCFICDHIYSGSTDDPTDPDEILQTCMRELGGCGQKHGIYCPQYEYWRRSGQEY